MIGFYESQKGCQFDADGAYGGMPIYEVVAGNRDDVEVIISPSHIGHGEGHSNFRVASGTVSAYRANYISRNIYGTRHADKEGAQRFRGVPLLVVQFEC